MASGDVIFRLTADEARAIRAYQKLIDKEREMIRTTRNLGKTSQRAGKRTESAMSRGAKEALGFAGALTGIGSAVGGVMVIVNQLRKEYQHLVDQQRRAAISQMTISTARNTAMWNKPPDITEGELNKMVERLATRPGYEISRERLWRLAASMLSAKGDLGPAEFKGAFGEAARLGAVAGEGLDIPAIAGAIGDVMKQAEIKDPRAAGGLLRQFGYQSRILDAGKQAKALIKSMTAAEPFGSTQEEGIELTVALSQLAADVEGELASTGGIRLMQTLTGMRSSPIRAAGKKIKLTKRGMAGLHELQDIYAGLNELEQDSLLANMQLGRGGVRGASMQLIRRTPAAMKAFEAAKKNISSVGEGTAAVWESYFTEVATGRQEPLRAGRRAIRAATETQQMKNVPGAMAGMLRDEVREFLEAVPGISKTEIELGSLLQEIRSGAGTGDMVGAARQRLEDLQDRRGIGKKYIGVNAGGPGMIARGPYLESLPADAERVEPCWLDEKLGHRGYWRSSSPALKGTTKLGFGLNPDYDPQQAEAFERLCDVLDRLEASLRANTGVSLGQSKPEVNSQVMD